MKATVLAATFALGLVTALLSGTGCSNSGQGEAGAAKQDEELERIAKLLDNGLREQAEGMLNARVKLSPDDADTYLLLGVNELQKGEMHKAIDPYFQTAVKLNKSLVPEVFGFTKKYVAGEACALRGVSFPARPEGTSFDRSPLTHWMFKTDRTAALADEAISALGVEMFIITIEDFMEHHPESARINHLLLFVANNEWNSEGGEDKARQLVNTVLGRASKGSKDEREARNLLAEWREDEARTRALKKEYEERQLQGLWENLESAFQTTMEFMSDGTWMFRVGALQEGGGYSVDGSALTMWGKSSWDGKPIRPSSGTWRVNGNELVVTGNVTAHGRYRRIR